MAGRPANFPVWTDGSPDKVMQPTNELAAQGFSADEVPTYQNINYQFFTINDWLMFLDGQSVIASIAASLFNNARLEDGGYWNWYVGSSQLGWTDSFYISLPGVDASFNQCAAGNVTLNDGDIAYVNANIPFATSGDISSASNVVQNVAETAGIAVGQTVVGDNIPTGTTVSSISGNTVELSDQATNTANGQLLTFVSNAPVSVQTIANNAFQPQANSLIIAIRYGDVVYIGVNAITSVMRDGEFKKLGSDGYTHLIFATAGQPLSQGQAVYISDGTDSRTSGNIYLSDSSTANGASRGRFAGFVMTSQAQGNTVAIVSAGTASAFFSGLAVGKTYYVDPATPGAITATLPALAGQYIVPVGIAQDASDLFIGPNNAGTQVQSSAPWPQYPVVDEASLNAALTNCANAGGGVLLIQSSFTIAGQPFIPDNTIVVGRGPFAKISFSVNGSLACGANCRFYDCYLQNTDGTVQHSLLSVYGSRVVIKTTTFVISNSAAACLNWNSNGNVSRDCKFVGVMGRVNGIGIAYNGTECNDYDPTFTQG